MMPVPQIHLPEACTHMQVLSMWGHDRPRQCRDSLSAIVSLCTRPGRVHPLGYGGHVCRLQQGLLVSGIIHVSFGYLVNPGISVRRCLLILSKTDLLEGFIKHQPRPNIDIPDPDLVACIQYCCMLHVIESPKVQTGLNIQS